MEWGEKKENTPQQERHTRREPYMRANEPNLMTPHMRRYKEEEIEQFTTEWVDKTTRTLQKRRSEQLRPSFVVDGEEQ